MTSSGAGEKSGVPSVHSIMTCTGIGAGELLVDAARRIERLLAIGHLVGESVAGRQRDEGRGEDRKQHDAEQRCRGRAGATTRSTTQPTTKPSPSMSLSAGV